MMQTSGYLDMELLRFTTAGNVDDGKSTLIGRLLYDSKSIFEDQLEAIETASKKTGGEEVNLALLTDGLRAEREQGITIDVAYRYFATPKRKFIIADTPGHIQYTRNMVTGASTADLAIILVDARNGVLEQTIRHSYIASLLQIPNIVVCINKMDLVDFSEETYNTIREEYSKIADKLNLRNVQYIPISAKLGDNVVEKSSNMNWYTGTTLMEVLESTPLKNSNKTNTLRFPVQYIVRPYSDKFHDFRGYAGRLSGGTLKINQAVTIYPSGLESRVKAIHKCREEIQETSERESLTIELTEDIDISRGDMIVAQENEKPQISQEINMMICWFNEKPLNVNNRYIVKHTTNETIGIVKKINFRVDINTLDKIEDETNLKMNDIAHVTIKTAQPLIYDAYNENRNTGSLILIDQDTFETVGAGMITL